MRANELDRIDHRLLEHLQRHGRASNVELAAVAHLSEPQCNRRHRRLEEEGFITGYHARLDTVRLGFGVVAFVHLSMEKGHIQELPDFKGLIADLAQVQECYSVTGDFDYVLKVIERDLQSLSRFLMDTLMRLPGVTSVRSSVCLEEIKDSSVLPLGG